MGNAAGADVGAVVAAVVEPVVAAVDGAVVAAAVVAPDVAVVEPGSGEPFEHAPAARARAASAASSDAVYLLMERLLSREGTRAPRLPKQVS